VHQNLQHDWWKEGPKYEQMAVAQEAQQEDEDEDDESVVQNSNSFCALSSSIESSRTRLCCWYATQCVLFFGGEFVAKMGAMMIDRKILAKNWATS